ncbi:hypothetical protein PY092_09515 [Muricauda sp. 334s03]|uniref:Uncharacterized protein n=1 Tax=Flagellimonas yonaguniensis TaxID=3031325 RepID=A0ABT5XYY0_9FLAO|nr:hypothetical protein [[Muricauda] yonaguniensis]MDF0716385.1 hypothetical protein [[Muricauda] yonaguniensis]
MMTVHVFKTSVKRKGEVKKLRPSLNRLVDNNGCWNFDLEDCDNILRVESKSLNAPIISSLLRNKGFHCEELH